MTSGITGWLRRRRAKAVFDAMEGAGCSSGKHQWGKWEVAQDSIVDIVKNEHSIPFDRKHVFIQRQACSQCGYVREDKRIWRESDLEDEAVS